MKLKRDEIYQKYDRKLQNLDAKNSPKKEFSTHTDFLHLTTFKNFVNFVSVLHPISQISNLLFKHNDMHNKQKHTEGHKTENRNKFSLGGE